MPFYIPHAPRNNADRIPRSQQYLRKHKRSLSLHGTLQVGEPRMKRKNRRELFRAAKSVQVRS
jgi:hypothetical protein